MGVDRIYGVDENRLCFDTRSSDSSPKQHSLTYRHSRHVHNGGVSMKHIFLGNREDANIYIYIYSDLHCKTVCAGLHWKSLHTVLQCKPLRTFFHCKSLYNGLYCKSINLFTSDRFSGKMCFIDTPPL